jgi:hypothetical protein
MPNLREIQQQRELLEQSKVDSWDSTKTSIWRSGETSATREVPHVPRRGNLRDEFAAAALTGILANAGLCNDIGDEDVATYAYDYADAMIDARNKK